MVTGGEKSNNAVSKSKTDREMMSVLLTNTGNARDNQNAPPPRTYPKNRIRPSLYTQDSEKPLTRGDKWLTSEVNCFTKTEQRIHMAKRAGARAYW